MAGERIRAFFNSLRQQGEATLPEELTEDFPTADQVQHGTDNFADAAMLDVLRTGEPLNVVVRDGQVINAEVDTAKQSGADSTTD